MPNLPEAVLALFAGQSRAAAMMGDLAEMAETRGRAWLASAYLRTLVSFSWRTTLAIVVSYVYLHSVWVLKAVYSSMNWLFCWVPHASPSYKVPFYWLPLRPLMSLVAGVYVFVPFLWIRFGLRDRLTQLAFLLFLLALPGYSSRLLVAVQVYALTAIAILTALCLRKWRRPMVVLALSLTPRLALFEVLEYSYQPSHRTNFPAVLEPNSFAVIAGTAVLCLWLHRILLPPRATVA